MARGNLATQLQYQGRLVEAIAEFRDLIRQAPHMAMLHFNLGNALWKHGDLDEAAARMREALRLEPEHIEALINLGCIQCDSGAFDQGVTTLRDATRRRPDHPKAWGGLATALRNKGDLDGLRELTRQRPESPHVHAELGKALSDRGRYAEALGPLGKALELDPDSGWALAMLGTCQSQLGRHDEAIATFQRSLKLTPEDPRRTRTSARPSMPGANHLAAIAAFRESLRLKADEPHVHANLGNALLVTGDLDGAIAAYEQAIRLDPTDADHRYWLGMALERKGRAADAVAAYREAIRLRPDFPDARNHLSLTLYLAGQVEEAIRTVREEIRLHPDDAEASYHLGTLLQREGRGDDAIAELREAVRLEPSHPEALCNLGQALETQGLFEEALGYLRRGHEAGTKRGGWNYPSADWVAECERLAAGDRLLSAVLKGEARAEDNAKRALLAEVAHARSWYATAVRFSGEAIAADPAAADPAKSSLRYNGACYAALAGCGKGKDEPAPDAAARAALRRRAIEWLRADLAGWSKVLAAGKPEDRATDPAGARLLEGRHRTGRPPRRGRDQGAAAGGTEGLPGALGRRRRLAIQEPAARDRAQTPSPPERMGDPPMTDANRCPSCEAERPANSPEGLCPRCLMQQALDTDPPVSAGASVLASLAATVGSVPRVLLRDDTATGEPPRHWSSRSPPRCPTCPTARRGSSSSARSPAAAWAPC